MWFSSRFVVDVYAAMRTTARVVEFFNLPVISQHPGALNVTPVGSGPVGAYPLLGTRVVA